MHDLMALFRFFFWFWGIRLVLACACSVIVDDRSIFSFLLFSFSSSIACLVWFWGLDYSRGLDREFRRFPCGEFE
jgi:hypothetical protein